jgi:hypothetical protein
MTKGRARPRMTTRAVAGASISGGGSLAVSSATNFLGRRAKAEMEAWVGLPGDLSLTRCRSGSMLPRLRTPAIHSVEV